MKTLTLLILAGMVYAAPPSQSIYGWGTAAPDNATCGASNYGALYIETDVPQVHACGTDGDWHVVGGGSGTGDAAATEAVTYGATPTFTMASNTLDTKTMTLTGNVTNCTIASATAGQTITWVLTASGATRTFACAGITNLGTLSIADTVTCTITANATSSSAAFVKGSISCPNGNQLTFVAGGAAEVTFPTGTYSAVGTAITNTFGAAGTLNMSAATNDEALRVPNVAGAANTSDGAISYDTTNKNLHAGTNGADGIVPIVAATPTNGNCPKWVVSASKVSLSNDTCSGGSVVCDPQDPDVLCFVEDFMLMSTYNSTFFSTFPTGSSFSNSAATAAGRPGILQVGSGATPSPYGVVAPLVSGTLGGATAGIIGSFLASSATGTLSFDFRLQSTSDVKVYLGFGDSVSATFPVRYVALRYDTSLGDTAWTCATDNNGSGSDTETITGGTPDTSYHRFILTKTGANTFTCAIDAGAASTAITTAVTADISLGAWLNAATASNKQFSIDRIAVALDGLGR